MTLPRHILAGFGLSHKLDRLRTTDSRGQFHLQSTYLDYPYLGHLVDNMRRLVHSCGHDMFQDFFFFN